MRLEEGQLVLIEIELSSKYESKSRANTSFFPLSLYIYSSSILLLLVLYKNLLVY